MSTILIVPGLQGSGPAHWQSWFERQLPDCVRVEQSDWHTPQLTRWAGAVRQQLDRATGHVWIVAHSFGCLAAAHAAWDYRDRVAGAMFVAPADPEKFGVSDIIPTEHLGFPSVVVSSTNDPWVRLMRAAWLAHRWGSRFIDIGAAGHINVDAGFGPWPEGLLIFEQLRRAQADLPLGQLGGPAIGIVNKSERMRPHSQARRALKSKLRSADLKPSSITHEGDSNELTPWRYRTGF